MSREEAIQKIRNFMVQKMETLRSSMDKAISNLKTDDDRPVDYLDLAAREASKAVELKCRSKEWESLLETKETILRIDLGLYGMCDSCGRQISHKRLLAVPMSKLCLNCQEEKEVAFKQSRRRKYSGSKMRHHYA